ncbi:MAG: aldo/keto reductase [Planctomycetes bacterium GWF2_41_51]|nr:MAG: aldo/keto reductase [Planctomycetes bacterium GWF2_41_51]HBG25795.1 aldo/keto reductase [Phycisphaerales bacterium]
MIYRTLGSTGQKVSAIGIGGAHLSRKNVDERLAIRIIRTAIDNGITFMDNSWDYSNGQSELRLGKALRDGYRQKAFVMTKVDGRSKDQASKQLEDSLKRLNVDHIDLVQHHEIIRYEDPDRIFDTDGANEALIRARDAGKIRYIGFTGHKDPHVHLYMLEVAERFGFKFDTVQLPLNLMDAHFRSFANLVLPRLVMRNIGVLGMKCLADGVLLKSKTVTAIECIHYALNLPTSVVITGIDSLEILNQALEAVTTYYPLSEQELSDLLAKTADAGSTGKFEPYKTSSIFDSTAQNPQWLGEEPRKIRELVSV